MGITRQVTYLRDFAEEAQKLRKNYGVTNLYSTSQGVLDDYLGGGYGRMDGYEIVLLYGATGVGKSTVGLNFLKDPIERGVKVGLLVLEDDGPDVFIRMSNILGPEGTRKHIMGSENIHFMPQESLVRSWNLDDLLETIEEWFDERDIDLIFLDHLQFAFEGAESIRGENEYIAQRVFMQKLNQLMKKNKKTIILVSHVNKASGAKGMDKIVGSGAIAQVGTKVIEVAEDDVPEVIKIHMRKSRFTRKLGDNWCMRLVDGKLEQL